MTDIDKLQIEIEASSTDAAKEVNRLADAMKNLKSAMGGKFNNPIKDIQKSAKGASVFGDTEKTESVRLTQGKIEPQDSQTMSRAEQKAAELIAEIDDLDNRLKEAGITGGKAFSDMTSSEILAMSQAQLLDVRIESIKQKLDKAASSGKVSASELAKLAEQVHRLESQKAKLTVDSSDVTKAERRVSGLTKLLDFVKKIAVAPFVSLKNAAGNSIKSINKFTSSIGRILMYRAIRAGLKEITQSIKEGIDNLYQYSQIVGTEFHKSLDSLAADALYVKNSFATVAAPIINYLRPAFDILAESIANALNLLAQFMARITGASSYSKAIKSVTKYGDAVSSANKKVKSFTISIDELNVINDSAGGGSGKAIPDYASMFEEVDIENINPKIKNFADDIKNAISNGDWRGSGRLLAEKLNGVIDNFNAYNLGSKIGEKINNAIDLAYGFLRDFSFLRLGGKIAEFINGSLEKIDFDTIGRTIIRWFLGLPEMIIGFVETLDWGLVARKISDFISGSLNEFSDWASEINWVSLGNSLYTSLKEFFTNGETSGINYDGLAESFFRALGSAFGIAVGIVDGFFTGVWDDLKKYFEEKVSEAGGSVPKAFFQGILDGLNLIGRIEDWIDEHISEPFLNGVKGALEIEGEESKVMKLYGEGVSNGFKNGILRALPWYGAVKRAQWVIENLVNPIINSVKEGFGIHSPSTVMEEIGKYLLDGLFQGLEGIGTRIGKWGNDLISSIKNALGIHSPSTEMKEVGEYSVEGLQQGFCGINVITKMFKNEMENCKNAASDFSNHVESEFNKLSGTVNTKITDGLNYYKTSLNEAQSHTKTAAANMTNAYNSMSNNSVSAIGRIISALNNIPRNITTVHTIVTENVSSESSRSVPSYASGGFPEDGLFFANHSELVGKFTNGKTAVANNQEIVAGIANGVENANAEQNALLREQNDLLTAILAKTGSVSIDGKTLMTSVERAQRQRGANIMAGGVMA